MTHQSPTQYLRVPIDAGRQVAQLRHVLRLVEEIAGRKLAPGADDAALDESARVSSAYDAALPIVQRRFDALAAETATWSASAVEALLSDGPPPTAAPARCLADELSRSLKDLAGMLRA